MIAALADEDPGPLRTWLAGRGADHRALWRLPQWNAGDQPGDTATLRQGPRDSEQRVAEVLARQMPLAAAHPGGLVMLLLYLIYEVEQAWERSYHYRPMWHTLRGAQQFLDTHPSLISEADGPAVRATSTMMSCLDSQIRVENALVCGDLAELGRAAVSAVDAAAQTLASTDTLGHRFPALAAHLREKADACESYYRALCVAAADLRRFRAEGGSLDQGIAALAAAERDDRGCDHYDRSELRAHRFDLVALQAAQDRDWWWIDHGKMVYVYPFALRGITPQEVVRRASDRGVDWSIGGVAPAAVQDHLDQDDVWDGSDYLGRGYDGALIEMPGATLRAADGTVAATFQVELRLSRLGNHYVRLESELVNASPYDVYLAMFRAAPEHGYADVTLDVAGAESHPRLCDLAVRLAQDLATNLDPPVRAITRPGMFHVLLSLHAASLTHGYQPHGQRREVRDPEALLDAIGAGVLTNPVTHCVGSIAEWIRYRYQPEAHRDSTGVGRQMWWTCNTTVLPALGEPEFSATTRETIVEFVASLEGLFAGWSSELASYHQWISAQVPDVSKLAEEAVPEGPSLDDLAAQLEHEQLRLHDFATETRSVVALIESPSLLSSPVAAAILASALRAAGYPQRRAELAQRTEEVLDARLGLRIEALARRRLAREAREAARQERRRRARLDTMLAVIAAIGISGLGQIIQAGYDLRVAGAVWIVAAITLLAAVVGVAVWRLADRSGGSAEADDSPAPAPPARRAAPPAGPAGTPSTRAPSDAPGKPVLRPASPLRAAAPEVTRDALA